MGIIIFILSSSQSQEEFDRVIETPKIVKNENRNESETSSVHLIQEVNEDVTEIHIQKAESKIETLTITTPGMNCTHACEN